MANYKSGFKRKENDRFVSYILIGFTATFFVIILSVILYNAFSKDLEYDSFDRIEDYSLIGDMPESEYLVYYYSDNCYYCSKIEIEVLSFADDNNRNIKVYFLDAGNVTGYNNVPGLNGTPSLVTVINGQMVDLSSGSVKIVETFEKIDEGSYIYLN